ncbi:hypothetical protein P389DRAFT_193424 [Cystobasidium minutum MCA 4210]|uniref:uncharacterized protein n=1 Tax=Cystobasidium minutum MCA 4210 TaxID=1397322 RepID=UPI0034CF779F|eukprot:jgi/Rhomi1/193424/gm1.1638_g
MLSHCPACNAFLPPSESIDYFELFSLPSGFSLDKSQLKRKFLQWQGLVHPDRLPPAKDSQARRQQEDWANMWSSIVNEGYKTLGDDRLRGEYILEKKGVAISEEDKMDDPELLMEIMEVREALEDAQTQEEVDEIRENNAENTKQTLADLETLLKSDNIDPEEAKNLLIRLRYMNNVEGVCREWQPGKEIVLQH